MASLDVTPGVIQTCWNRIHSLNLWWPCLAFFSFDDMRSYGLTSICDDITKKTGHKSVPRGKLTLLRLATNVMVLKDNTKVKDSPFRSKRI